MNDTLTERQAFSNRLQQCLRNARYSPASPTRLAREFNRRFDGRPVTVHAARKWLVGEAIPTQEKIRTLAEWLQVPREWLRYGEEQCRGKDGIRADGLKHADADFIADLKQLNEDDRALLRRFVDVMLRSQYQKRLP